MNKPRCDECEYSVSFGIDAEGRHRMQCNHPGWSLNGDFAIYSGLAPEWCPRRAESQKPEIPENVQRIIEDVRAVDGEAAEWLEENVMTLKFVSVKASRLKGLFIWGDTPQGQDYWKNIDRQINHNQRPQAKSATKPEQDIDYYAIAEEIADLVVEKQDTYGDSVGQAGKVMRIFYPNGISPEQMNDALVVVRVIDKLFRIANQRDASGKTPWRNVVEYGLLAAARETAGR